MLSKTKQKPKASLVWQSAQGTRCSGYQTTWSGILIPMKSLVTLGIGKPFKLKSSWLGYWLTKHLYLSSCIPYIPAYPYPILRKPLSKSIFMVPILFIYPLLVLLGFCFVSVLFSFSFSFFFGRVSETSLMIWNNWVFFVCMCTCACHVLGINCGLRRYGVNDVFHFWGVRVGVVSWYRGHPLTLFVEYDSWRAALLS